MAAYRLFGSSGTGSMIVEAAFSLAGVPVELEPVEWSDTGWESSALRDLNPLGQLPTLVLPDGSIMTESAAMLLHLADLHPEAGLAPPPDAPERTKFLRWLVFLVSAVYPTFTYGDVPKRFVGGDEGAAERLREGTDAHRLDLLGQLEAEAGAPWFLGERFSAIDLYLRSMSFWRPGREWFEKERPRIFAIAEEVGKIPEVAAVEARNFP